MLTSFRTLTITGRSLPVKVVRERRRSMRVSLGKKHVIVRLPQGITDKEEATYWKDIERWLAERPTEDTDPLARYAGRDYQDGDTLRIGQRQYELVIRSATRKSSGARLSHGTIHLTLSDELSEPERQKALSTLISRVVAKDFKPAIVQRVHELNERHFQRPLRKIFLKNNHSNWGSCSTDNNINLSTRLLFAPPEVIDYVIIHELAHLVEANHSTAFWAEVARAMPEYHQHEAWLKMYGAECYY